ncbi:YjfB family protein [Marinobacterium litorale]|uniref:YjfB family protein n=1 Tax=Marinobacterium litorale TaxID=404770 RepID=UPI00041BD585|nr:YjfB family protein [Marinobacterium litorale]
MDIAGLSTAMSQMQTQTEHATKVHSMVKDQTEAMGEQALALIESAAPRPVDPASSLGQNIDIRA